MTEEERLESNSEQGYTFVALTKSGELYKKRNEAGGWSYYGESCDIFGMIWDECLSSKEEFIAIAYDLYKLKLNDI